MQYFQLYRDLIAVPYNNISIDLLIRLFYIRWFFYHGNCKEKYLDSISIYNRSPNVFKYSSLSEQHLYKLQLLIRYTNTADYIWSIRSCREAHNTHSTHKKIWMKYIFHYACSHIFVDWNAFLWKEKENGYSVRIQRPYNVAS